MLQISGLTWAVTIGVIVALLALDLALAALRPHRVGFREATAWSVFYILVALAFGAWMWWAHGSEFGTEYLAGYIVEKSLSVDNLFVFVIIMTTFAVPEEHQHKVLTFGIVLALIMRGIFIAAGAANDPPSPLGPAAEAALQAARAYAGTVDAAIQPR